MLTSHSTSPTDRFRLRLSSGQEPIPRPVASPADEAVVVGLPRAVALGQVAPGCAGPELPQDAVHDRAMVLPLLASPAVLGQKRRDALLHPVGQLAPSNHGFSYLLVEWCCDEEVLAEARAIYQTRPKPRREAASD
jgi:hypothetical protein